jgi:hypothetical protein
MPITVAPPWLLKLAAPSGPLVDDRVVQRELVRKKIEAEREDRIARDELFVGPMAPPEPRPEPTLPFDLQAEPTPRRLPPLEPPPPPVAPIPRADLQDFVAPPPAGLEMPLIAPPDAPPPPVDRPPGTFGLPFPQDDDGE